MSEDPVAQTDHTGDSETAVRNARYGSLLFVVYLVLYGCFMALNVYDPKLMSSTPLGGVNLAILFGFGLIVAALLLAGVYMWLVRADAGKGGQ